MKYTLLSIFAACAILAAPVAAEELTNTAETEQDENTSEAIKLPEVNDRKRTLNRDLDLKSRIDQSKENFKSTVELRKVGTLTNEEIKAKREAAQAAFKAAVEARKKALKEEIAKIKKEKLAVRKEFVLSHFTAVAAQLQKRQDRVAILLEKMKGQEKDITSAKAALESSKASLKTAQDILAELKTKAADSESQTTTLKELAKKAEAALKKSKDSLVQVLKLVEKNSSEVTTQ
jgi:hypothetical protein